ncbi:MAG: hypothetical protein V3U02_02325 [Calditrichia bacterium]
MTSEILLSIATILIAYCGIVTMYYDRYFKKDIIEKRHICPSKLRHTWVMGYVTIFSGTIMLSELKGVGLTTPHILVMSLLVFFITIGAFFIFSDLLHHIKDNRGIFEHHPECYMDKGNRDTWSDVIRGRE